MHETVREALKDVYEIVAAKDIKSSDGEQISYKDLQDLLFERVVSAIDLLGMEDIYLDKEGMENAKTSND